MPADFLQRITSFATDGTPNMKCPKNTALFGFSNNYYDYFEY